MPKAASQSPRIFICYRRDDTAGHAGRLHDRLAGHFGDGQIFMDVEDRIEPGEDFMQTIDAAISSCKIMLVLIGRNWLTSRDGAERQINGPGNFVSLEIRAALAFRIRVIPVLLQGVPMPSEKGLPKDISPLARRQAIVLSDQHWKHDVDQFIRTLEKSLASGRRAPLAEWPLARAATGAVVGLIVIVIIVIYMSITAPTFRNDNDNLIPNSNAPRPTPQPGPTLPISLTANPPSQQFRNEVGMEFIWIPPGSFLMGAENGNNNKATGHQVTIREGFYMGKYEVTQAQWQAVMENNPSTFKGDDLPVQNVSWDDAQKFISELNAREDGHVYRLPGEAEWEYAARAGTTANEPGDLDASAWYIDNSVSAHPVGKKRPNAFGLFDMKGNVWEWCQDLYQRDGSKPGKKDAGLRIIRGGAWSEPATFVSLTSRYMVDREKGSRQLGFRVASLPKP
jgi:formylglycine-generating enzyme required for sulfatase activity